MWYTLTSLPACHAIYLLAEFHIVYIAEHWGIIHVPLLCHGHSKKSSGVVGLTQRLTKLANEVAYDAW